MLGKHKNRQFLFYLTILVVKLITKLLLIFWQQNSNKKPKRYAHDETANPKSVLLF